jgi:hypothetical protein
MIFFDNDHPTRDHVLGTMAIFALAGADYLSRAENARIRTAFLNTKLAVDSGDIFAFERVRAIEALKQERIRKGGNEFIPFPAMNKEMRSGNLVGFFRPRLYEKANGIDSFGVELLLVWPKSDFSAALRFEKGFRGDTDPHHFCHVQISPSLNMGAIGGFVPTSLPELFKKFSPTMPLPAIKYSTWFSLLLSLCGQQRNNANGIIQVFNSLYDFDPDNHPELSSGLNRAIQALTIGEQAVPRSSYSIGNIVRWLLGRS